MWTQTMALVLGDSTREIVSAVMFWLLRSTSAKERPRRGDDLVARPDAERLQREVERHRAVHQRDRVAAAGPGGEFLLELAAKIAGPVVDPVRREHGADRVRRQVRGR